VSNFIAIDEEANHQVMHGDRPRKAQGLPRSSLQPGPECEVLAFNRLSVAFAHGVLFRGEMAPVGAPFVRVVAGDTTGIQEGFEFQERIVCAAAHDIRYHAARVVIERVPQPPRRLFVADKTPHLVKFYLELWVLIARLPRPQPF
jgi:hypothetical protein